MMVLPQTLWSSVLVIYHLSSPPKRNITHPLQIMKQSQICRLLTFFFHINETILSFINSNIIMCDDGELEKEKQGMDDRPREESPYFLFLFSNIS